jgi:tetratricopeptide (TPR) repeat protein
VFRLLPILCFALLLPLADTPQARAVEDPVVNKATRALEKARAGALARRNGDIVGACRAFEGAVELTPTWAVAQLELGRCYRLLGDPKGSALTHLNLALKWLPAWSLIHIELGRLAEDNRRLDAAGVAYSKAESLAAADIRAAGGAARLAPHNSGSARLIRLRRILKRQPGNLALLHELAVNAEAVSAFDEAQDALVKILERSRYPQRAAARLVRFGQRTGRLEAQKIGKNLLSKGFGKGKTRSR